MKKKLLTGMFSMAMMVAIAVPACAEDMSVTYEQANSYTMSIPATVTLTKDTEVTASITSTAMNIAPNKILNVKVKSGISDGRVTLTRTGDSTKVTPIVALTTGSAIGIENNAVVATFTGTTTTPASNGTLYFASLGDDVKAGNYTGTITFEMIVE